MIIKVQQNCSEAEVERLKAAGFAPVLRWVELDDPTGATFKTVEALSMLDRREERRKSPKAQPKPKGNR